MISSISAILPKIYNRPGHWFNKKMTSYQYRKSRCGDKTILRPPYLHNGIYYTGKMPSLYWISPLGVERKLEHAQVTGWEKISFEVPRYHTTHEYVQWIIILPERIRYWFRRCSPFLWRAMNSGTRIIGQLRQPTTYLHTWLITWDIIGCLCLFKQHSPKHTPD